MKKHKKLKNSVEKSAFYFLIYFKLNFQSIYLKRTLRDQREEA